MIEKYRKLAVIPAFFISVLLVSACTKKDIGLEPFKDFSNDEKDVAEITDQNDEILDVSDDENKSNKVADTDFLRKYHIGYLTFDVADIFFEVKPIHATPSYVRYKTRVYSKTNGMVDYFMGWLSHTVGYTKIYSNKTVPEKFRTRVKHKKKVREIELVFDKSGKNYVVDKVTPPDNRQKRLAVSKANKRASFDPISGFLEARRLIKSAFEDNNFNSKGFYTFTLPIYDGRRRTDFLLSLQKKLIDGAYKLSVSQKAIAGYTKKELDKEQGASKAFLTIMLDPKDYVPVEVIGRHPLGTASADYVGSCDKSFEECIK